jgi:hypothetical protein
MTGGPGALLVSLFNVKWRCSAPAGGVEGSKFCLSSVILPAKCVYSISPRFHYRRLIFCFLPLAAILETQYAYFLRQGFYTLDSMAPSTRYLHVADASQSLLGF